MTRQGSDGRPAALPARLRKRADFLRAAKGVKSHRPAFVLQMAACPDADAPSALGYTLTKNFGDAVARNRMRRRLKEAVRLSPDLALSPAAHYVLVG
ncbi:MAG: ribonuclease P protein component, partial [Hyphomicrobiales bacterium]|nr:ribonuclease P protein component [Hyphomicrobiales bacterium]